MNFVTILRPIVFAIFETCPDADLASAADDRRNNRRRFERQAQRVSYRAARIAARRGEIDRSDRAKAAAAMFDDICDATDREVAACLEDCKSDE